MVQGSKSSRSRTAVGNFFFPLTKSLFICLGDWKHFLSLYVYIDVYIYQYVCIHRYICIYIYSLYVCIHTYVYLKNMVMFYFLLQV